MCVNYVSALHMVRKRKRKKSCGLSLEYKQRSTRQDKPARRLCRCASLPYLHMSVLTSIDLIMHASGLRSFNVVTTHGDRQGHIAAAGSRGSSHSAHQNRLAKDEASGKWYGDAFGTLSRLRLISAHDRRATPYRRDGRRSGSSTAKLQTWATSKLSNERAFWRAGIGRTRAMTSISPILRRPCFSLPEAHRRITVRLLEARAALARTVLLLLLPFATAFTWELYAAGRKSYLASRKRVFSASSPEPLTDRPLL
jgi:hypothetical protein